MQRSKKRGSKSLNLKVFGFMVTATAAVVVAEMLKQAQANPLEPISVTHDLGLMTHPLYTQSIQLASQVNLAEDSLYQDVQQFMNQAMPELKSVNIFSEALQPELAQEVVDQIATTTVPQSSQQTLAQAATPEFEATPKPVADSLPALSPSAPPLTGPGAPGAELADGQDSGWSGPIGKSLMFSAATSGISAVVLGDGSSDDGKEITKHVTPPDMQGPDVTITLVDVPEDSLTNQSPLVYTVQFSEEVEGFDSSDISIQNGEVIPESFSQDPEDPTLYTFWVDPQDGEVEVHIAAGVVEDAAGHANTESNTVDVDYDGTAPTAEIIASVESPTNQQPIPFTVTFSEAITGFTIDDISVVNGIVEEDSLIQDENDPNVFHFNVVPDEGIDDADISVTVVADSVQDAAGNGNEESENSVEYDTVSPSGSLSIVENTATQKVFQVTFDEAVKDFDESDIQVTNGQVASSTLVQDPMDPNTYTFTIIPDEESGVEFSGDVDVSIPADVLTDLAGNDNTDVSQETAQTLSITITKELHSDTPFTDGTNQGNEVGVLDAGDILHYVITITNGDDTDSYTLSFRDLYDAMQIDLDEASIVGLDNPMIDETDPNASTITDSITLDALQSLMITYDAELLVDPTTTNVTNTASVEEEITAFSASATYGTDDLLP